MKQFRLLWAAAGATVLLGALVASASAGRLSMSANTVRATWTRLSFSGGFGTIECEVVIEGSVHSRTINKWAGALYGYVTAANVPRCARGGVTILRETLPWHATYSAFTGTLPNITGIETNVNGVSFSVREPSFGITCLARGTVAAFYNRETTTGTSVSISASGTLLCGSFNGTISGTSSALEAREATRITVTLI